MFWTGVCSRWSGPGQPEWLKFPAATIPIQQIFTETAWGKPSLDVHMNLGLVCKQFWGSGTSLLFMLLYFPFLKKSMRKRRCIWPSSFPQGKNVISLSPSMSWLPGSDFLKVDTFHKGKLLSDGVVRRHSQLLSALSCLYTLRQLKAKSFSSFRVLSAEQPSYRLIKEN